MFTVAGELEAPSESWAWYVKESAPLKPAFGV
jgi:hypothetical protein